MKLAALTLLSLLGACKDDSQVADQAVLADLAADAAFALPDLSVFDAPPSLLTNAAGSPSSFACNGHFTDGPAQGTMLEPFHSTAFQNTATGPAAGVSIRLVDAATGAPMGSTFTADANGDVSITVVANTRIAWQSTGNGCDDTCVDSYEFNRLALPDASGAISSQIAEIDKYVALDGADAQLGAILGTVEDCDGQPVTNAQVELSSQACAGACTIEYLGESELPDASRTGTSSTGQFVIRDVSPGSVHVTVSGVTAAGGPIEVIGELPAFVYAQSLTFGTTTPLRN